MLSYKDKYAAWMLSPSQSPRDLQGHPDTGQFPGDKLGNDSSYRHLLFHVCLALWTLFVCVDRAVDNYPRPNGGIVRGDLGWN